MRAEDFGCPFCDANGAEDSADEERLPDPPVALGHTLSKSIGGGGSVCPAETVMMAWTGGSPILSHTTLYLVRHWNCLIE